MSWFGNLKIRTKFNLIMSLLLVFLFVAAAFLTYQLQQTLILKLAVDNARSFAKQIIETRDYLSGVVKGEVESNYALVPQVVATQVAKRISKDSRYYVRQVSLRYRNPENRPTEYEARQLQTFARGKVAEAYSVVSFKGESTFHYLQPMVAVQSCLSCHGEYDKAPAFVRERFPRGHFSYNYKVGEVIGAVSVSIPMHDLYREIGANLKLDLFYRGAIFFIIIFVMGIALRRSIIDPVKMLSETITRVTRTGNFTDRLPKRMNDEIGQLIGAFNDLMEELERKTLQSKESEDRYRNFIGMARSAVVTFMQDGKILITNQKAEELLGRSSQELLGENIFQFLENGDAQKKWIASYSKTTPTTTMQKIHSYQGVVTQVEMVLSVSQAGQQPMFTAILREL
jgi:PAS domain S-box-containing protein